MTMTIMRAVLFVALAVGAISPAAGGQARSAAQPEDQAFKKAIFAGGCFWCMEPPFDRLDGVISTTSGYTGGNRKNPTYGEVSAGVTGHAEAVEVLYDPLKIGYAQLLEIFWRNIDPLTPNRQFCDRGSQYRSAIFYHDAGQEHLARQSKAQLERSGRFEDPIVTEIVQATAFYRAESYHQDYYTKNPLRYKLYKWGCGRDARLKQLWGETASRDQQRDAPLQQ